MILLVKINDEKLKEMKSKLDLKNIKISNSQLMELYNKAHSMANGIDEYTYLNLAFSKLDARKKDKEQEKVRSNFAYVMQILNTLSKM